VIWRLLVSTHTAGFQLAVRLLRRTCRRPLRVSTPL
jgi:hypothetical protein